MNLSVDVLRREVAWWKRYEARLWRDPAWRQGSDVQKAWFEAYREYREWREMYRLAKERES